MQVPVQNNPDFNSSTFFQSQFAPSPLILNNLSNADLMKLMKSNKQINEQIQTYLHTLFNPFFESGLFQDARFSRALSPERYKFTVEKTQLVLIRAISFNPELVLTCVKLFPELMTSVLETREVTVKYPLNNVCFTSQWHFKLPHLIARYGSCGSKSALYDIFREKTEPHKAEGEFFSTPISWKTEDLEGKKGPTPLFISVLFQNDYFASEIANHNTTFILKDDFDEPFQKINPFYLALENEQNPTRCSFLTLFNQYYSPHVKECIHIAISKASKGDGHLLKIILDSPSKKLPGYLADTPEPLFHLIDTNNLSLLRLICTKIDSFKFIHNEVKTPLFAATEKALQDDTYLPMVRLLLCCGSETTGLEHQGLPSPKTLLQSNSVASLSHNSQKQTLLKYFKVANLFRKIVKHCGQNDLSLRFDFNDEPAINPETTLLACAQIDSVFFNELVIAFFATPNGEWMLNKALNHFEDRMRYFECLFKFASEQNGTAYLTAETLEKIGDAILAYRKQCQTNIPTHKDPAFEYATFMYDSAMNKAAPDSECHQRIQAKYLNVYDSFKHISSNNEPGCKQQ